MPSEERLFSLVLALVASPQGVTRAELLSSVYGYAHRADDASASAAIERQFERDKEQIRLLGIPLETLDSPLEPGNNQLTRYRISKERLQLPESVRFGEDELAMLRIASFAWSEGSLESEARWVAMKLASLGANVDVQHIGVAPRLTISEPSAAALQQAIEARRAVTFDYQLPGRDTPLSRHVAPLRLHQADGRWHLVAYDLDREAPRVFLLQRITSRVTLLSESFSPELLNEVPDAIEALEALVTSQPALVSVEPGSIAQARLATRVRTEQSSIEFTVDSDSHESMSSAATNLRLHTLDYFVLADEIVGLAGEAVAREPSVLRARVSEVLHLIRSQHTDALSGDNS